MYTFIYFIFDSHKVAFVNLGDYSDHLNITVAMFLNVEFVIEFLSFRIKITLVELKFGKKNTYKNILDKLLLNQLFIYYLEIIIIIIE